MAKDTTRDASDIQQPLSLCAESAAQEHVLSLTKLYGASATPPSKMTREEMTAKLEQLQRQNEGLIAAVVKWRTEERSLSEAKRELDRILDSVSAYLWSAEVESDGHLSYRCYSRTSPWASSTSSTSQVPVPRPWAAQIHEEDQLRIREAMSSLALRDVDHVAEEYRIVQPDGAVRWLREVISISETQTTVRRLDAIVSDVTDRKNSELALRASEEKYRHLHESMTDGYVCVDMQGRIIESNRPYREMLGYSELELRQMTYHDLTPPEWAAWEAAIVHDQILPRGYSDVYEKEYYCKSGSIVPVELRTFLLRDMDGNPTAMWATVRDITSRKRVQHALEDLSEILEKEVDKRSKELEDLNKALQAEIADRMQVTASLRKSEARYRTIVETAFEGVWIVDSSGYTIFANSRLAELLGYAPEEMIGKPIHTFVDPDWISRTMKSIGRVSQGVVEQYELKASSKTKETIWAIVSASPLFYEDEEYVGALQMLIDITERKKTEAILEEQRVKLVASSRMACLGVMASGIAHEINNPLATISGAAEQLGSVLSTERPDKAHVIDLSAKITRNVDRIANIVRALRTLARDGAGDPFEKVSIQKVVEDSLTLCTARFKAHGIRLIAPVVSAHHIVEARPHQLSQVLVNLLSNAHDAVAKTQDKWVKIVVSEADEAIEIRVTDSGLRPSPIAVEKMFTPFFTTKAPGQGLGLGLSLSRSMLEECGGQLFVDERQSNTSFVIQIPIRQSETGEA